MEANYQGNYRVYSLFPRIKILPTTSFLLFLTSPFKPRVNRRRCLVSTGRHSSIRAGRGSDDVTTTLNVDTWLLFVLDYSSNGKCNLVSFQTLKGIKPVALCVVCWNKNPAPTLIALGRIETKLLFVCLFVWGLLSISKRICFKPTIISRSWIIHI